MKNFDDFNKIFNLIEATTKPENISEIFIDHWSVNSIIYENALRSKDLKLLEAYFEKFEKYLNEKIFIEQLEKQNGEAKTPLMFAITSKSRKTFEIYWNFVVKFFKNEKLKKFLLKTDCNEIAALHYAAIKDDKNFFKFFLDFHLDLFELKELCELFKDENKFLHELILNSNSTNCKAIANLVEILWADEKEIIRGFLLQGQESIFSAFRNQEVYREKLKPFVKLLKSTFKADEMNQFNNIVEWSEEFESKFDEE